ncbi:MAG: 2-amino-4-hydroxy-6-hydroxymethyldihydropteridine diphosphokinase [Nitrospinota bacterium]
MTYRALIGIGSNLGNAVENCEKAVSLINNSNFIEVSKQSSWYRSEPVGITDQPWFVNSTLEIQTSLSPDELLKHLLDIEKKMGRQRREKWGPRIIDLDILDYEGQVINSETLVLPHPEMTQRRFVLEPLCEIASATLHPLEKKTFMELLKELPEKPTVERIPVS